MIETEALVIGAGIVGVTAALALQQRGQKVTVLDEYRPGEGCSYGNAGVITPSAFPLTAYYGILDVPRVLFTSESSAALDWSSAGTLLPWGARYAVATSCARVGHDTRLLHQLCAYAIPCYEQLVGADLPSVHRRGYLALHLSPAEVVSAGRLNAIRDSLGVAVEFLSSSREVAELEPSVAGICNGASLVSGAAHVTDPARFVRELAEIFVRRGGILRRDRVAELAETGSGTAKVSGAHCAYTAGTVVVATGAHANVLLSNHGHRIPLVAERGYHLDLDVEPGFIRRPAALPGLGVILSPTDAGARIAGISHFGAPGCRPRPDLLVSALQRLRRLLPGLRARSDARVWSGERPATPDSLPVVERVRGTSSIFVTTGHGHTGLTLAAVTASVLADLVTRTPNRFSDCLSSERFRLRPQLRHSRSDQSGT